MNHNLEKLIKQEKPIDNPFIKVTVGFHYLSSYIVGQQQQYLKQFGITSQQYNLLRILRGAHPNTVNVNTLKARMLDKMSDASRLVDRLVNLELVIKKPNILDRRILDVKITPKALEILSNIDQQMDKIAVVSNMMTLEEATQFNLIVDKMLGRKLEAIQNMNQNTNQPETQHLDQN